MKVSKPIMRVVSGIQPTGNLHLGNYLGAIKKVAERDGEDRFVLVNAQTRRVVTANDVSERSISQNLLAVSS